MSEESEANSAGPGSPTQASVGASGDRSGPPLRVLPDPDSPQAHAEALSQLWAASGAAGGAETAEPDWCVDAEAHLRGRCDAAEASDAAMSASERRAVHLTRQRIRAQAILTADEAEPRAGARWRRWAVLGGSVAMHVIAFAILANAVADLSPRERSGAHDHLFEAPAVIAFEPAPAIETEPEPTPELEPIVDEPEAIEPNPAAKPKPRAHEPSPSQPPAEPAAEPAPAGPRRLQGLEFSSTDPDAGAGLPAGDGSGRPGGGGGMGTGTGTGTGPSTGPGEPKPKADVVAAPLGGLLQPEYPPALERAGVEGSVLVKVWIDEHGHVIKAEVVESSGEEAFDHNALMVAQRQEWSAATIAGEPVASTRRYRVHFRQR